MASETDLLNTALGLIGEARITSIDDGSRNANQCQTFYPMLRDNLLRAQDWKFASAMIELARDVAVPLMNFAYSYALPADCLKVREYSSNQTASTPAIITVPSLNIRNITRWKIQGRHLLSSDSQVWVRYTRRVENPDEMDPIFVQALAMWLASYLASSISKDEATAKAKLADAVQVLFPLAAAVDGQEGTVEPFIADELTWGR